MASHCERFAVAFLSVFCVIPKETESLLPFLRGVQFGFVFFRAGAKAKDNKQTMAQQDALVGMFLGGARRFVRCFLEVASRGGRGEGDGGRGGQGKPLVSLLVFW